MPQPPYSAFIDPPNPFCPLEDWESWLEQVRRMYGADPHPMLLELMTEAEREVARLRAEAMGDAGGG